MKKKITTVIMFIITICMLNVSVYASADFDKAMKKAKKNLTTAMSKYDASLLIKSRGEFERILQLKEKTWLVNYYIALADYSLASTSMIAEDKAGLQKYTESGIAVIKKSIDEYPEFADAFVLLEALNFNRWQYEQEKMQEILSATASADESAVMLDKNNPRLLMLNGIASFYTPEAFGGGIDKAIPMFEKSIAAFETRKEISDLYPEWGNDMSMGYMAMCLIKRNDDGDMDKAKSFIDAALEINPESGFITGYVMDEYKKASDSK